MSGQSLCKNPKNDRTDHPLPAELRWAAYGFCLPQAQNKRPDWMPLKAKL